ncbi:50S ribosomal protein L18 [Candidatus Pseudothioglobus singularis]|jgi:large subunit ribosomal protein L18|uniref:Large ribosomal subunit protein uL18 n=1 Tax=Candidatus Pseudothioglobus singularis PS1 TaxID=1125411 RepID=A0A0M5L035_9GAMM|nr:50S ribosomal protein L18 [Candidatus Pseudothioglobus singularis]MBT5984395.1 50S ribosomal protein L18 [Thiotrichales bacterium]MDG1166970.1 50S ribosomal protein L18 [Candidatus Thioglobus sp.]ALE01386.1 50S ribosomal protein L18 [Candidatus Pseudothioglobus singularis PS1]ANQ66048.1 50S ribosomal protein L18 [Candidatus Pseudothioglobus singularis]MDA7438665.1 50S ribosomal protein L18 [Candidatus Pseudothioglobus singularis]|tara:strand:+ start:577 stop:924 length:348 start_codon:yes stop_codon:yes gene_type:complete
MKLSKKDARIRRATKFRAKHAERDLERLCVYKSSQHIYAQIISSCGTKTLASASSVSSKMKNGGNVDAASKVGDLIAKAAKKAKVSKVAFDRSGFKYHGRVKALADAAREGGLDF